MLRRFRARQEDAQATTIPLSEPSMPSFAGLRLRGATAGQRRDETQKTDDSWTPQPFERVIDISDVVHRRHIRLMQFVAMRAVATLLIVSALCVGLFPAAMQMRSSQSLSNTSDSAAKTVAGWPYPQAEDQLTDARAYNTRLAKEGQPILGEAADPFSSAAGVSRTSEEEDSASSQDEEYQGLLDSGSGIMGAISIPKISVKLPIYHGTSEQALAKGAGHLYGTSLPVGGADTHAVITGHRGLVEAMMFTRLDEMEQGDFMYVKVMGETLGYQVDRISVIDPNDTSRLKVEPGEDRLTLMTCTPYGINTQRLLVSGHRVSIPMPAPDPTDLHDARSIGLWAGIGVLTGGTLLCFIVLRLIRPKRRIMRHAGSWPSRG
ncbi:sortase [Bifidobacterium moukalabense DSM 27321]|uniref:Sortase n=2 Tax=Bifidobacterium moukalabense TaxID=1333651 RepID=W4NBH0_9BIFI|nr:sortase [Bifidobacterium moukalabense DSM 27321]